MIALFYSVALCAKEPKEIIEEAIAKQQIENSVQTIEMTLISRSGSEQKRVFEIMIRKDEDALRSYTRFLSPADIKGTQLVSIDRPGKKDPQLLYLPALKRVQRISGSAQKGSFMGSDFSFSDLELNMADNEIHSLESEDDSWWIIKTVSPNHKVYSSWSSKISKKDQLPYQIDYYAKNNTLIKSFVVEETKNKDGRIIPVKTRMKHKKKGSQTILEIQDIRLNVAPQEIPLHIFSPSYMEEND